MKSKQNKAKQQKKNIIALPVQQPVQHKEKKFA